MQNTTPVPTIPSDMKSEWLNLEESRPLTNSPIAYVQRNEVSMYAWSCCGIADLMPGFESDHSSLVRCRLAYERKVQMNVSEMRHSLLLVHLANIYLT